MDHNFSILFLIFAAGILLYAAVLAILVQKLPASGAEYIFHDTGKTGKAQRYDRRGNQCDRHAAETFRRRGLFYAAADPVEHKHRQ